VKSIVQKATFYRVCDPTWVDCCDGSYSARFGGRWNPPESFPTLYLNADVETARANALRNYEGEAFGIFDLNPTQRPHLQLVKIAPCEAVDALTPQGRRELKLPLRDKPHLGHQRCQAIGVEAKERGFAGVAARSAARPDGAELALFELHHLTPVERRPFHAWFLDTP